MDSHLLQKSKIRRFFLAVFLVLLLLPQPAKSQGPPITARVNTTRISTDELVVLTVTVVDDSAQQPRPLLPRLDGLAVVDLDIATDVDLIDGQIHTEVIYTYRLQARRTGSLTIPPIAVKIDDQTYKTPPVSIEVSQGAAPAPSPGNAVIPEDISPPADMEGQDFFIEAEVDRVNPFVGQQIIYTFRFYQALQVYREPQYEEPLLTEFETMGLPVQEYNLDVAERTYLVTEIRTALFPNTPGDMTIGPARLMLPGNIYEEPVDLYTEPIEINVRSLPKNAPPGFNGAVGQYQVEASFSPQVAVVNQPSTLFVSVSGIGNIRDLPELAWPELEGWQAYNSLTSMTTAMEGNMFTGTRVYERVMVPGQIGEFVIPAIPFIYFDPIAVEYKRVDTESLSVKVIPAPTPDATALAVGAGPTSTPMAVAETELPVGESRIGLLAWFDLLNLGQRLVTPLAVVLFAGLCGLLPVALLLGVGGNWLWRRRTELFPASKREEPPEQPPLQEEPIQQPRQSIHPVLMAAMKESNNNYKAVDRALNLYLSDALKSSVNGLTRLELAKRLEQSGLEESLVARIDSCLVQSELGRYGPVTEDAGWSLMVETDALLFELDKVFGDEE